MTPPTGSSTPAGRVRLRHVRPDDARRIFEWRNIPEIVALGATRRPVEWEEHVAWFGRVTTDPDRIVRVICEGDDDIGQVRIETTGDRVARVSIYLLPERTGRGLGGDALRQACAEAFRTLPIDSIEALVRDDNERSVGMFVRAGLRPSDRAVEPGHRLLTMSRPRDSSSATPPDPL